MCYHSECSELSAASRSRGQRCRETPCFRPRSGPMPKARRRRRPKRDWFRIPVDITEVLTTLADSAGLLQNLTTAVLTHDARITSIELSYNLVGSTLGEQPISMWICHSDYTLTEVEEVIELTGLLGPGEMIERERSKRLVRHIGDITHVDQTAESVGLNDGKPIKTRLNWLIPDGKTITMVSYNNTGSPLTTGAVVRVMGKINGYWQY